MIWIYLASFVLGIFGVSLFLFAEKWRIERKICISHAKKRKGMNNEKSGQVLEQTKQMMKETSGNKSRKEKCIKDRRKSTQCNRVDNIVKSKEEKSKLKKKNEQKMKARREMGNEDDKPKEKKLNEE